jgi:uncharacterized protein YycO
MSCWATVYTMMASWKHDRSMTINDALAGVKQRWVDLFTSGRGISSAAKNDFVADAGLIAEPPMNPSIEAWGDMLRRYGPIWITTDENTTDAGWAIHARVLTAIKGDGTAAGTQIRVIDPARGGRAYWEGFSTFLSKFESEAVHRPANWTLRVQMIHWPEGARQRLHSGAQSYRAGALSAPASPGLSDSDLAKLGLTRSQFEQMAAEIDAAPVVQAKSVPPAYAFQATQLPHVKLPASHWTSVLLRSIQSVPVLGQIVTKAFDFCDRFNITIGLGLAGTGGMVGGAAAGAGIVIGPGRRVGIYGTIGAVLGAIVSISGSIAFTIINGSIDDFSGLSVTAGATVDAGVGPGIGAHMVMNTSGQVIGFTGEIGLSAGLSPFEAFVGAHYTGSVTAVGQALSVAGLSEAMAYVSALADEIPLSPRSGGGRSIDTRALNKADIIVSTTTARVSSLIRWATDAPVSHASIYTGNNTVIEAVGSGVVETPLEDIINDPETSLAVAFRHLATEPRGWQDRAVNYAGAQLGRKYDFLNVVRQPDFRNAAENCNVLFDSDKARRVCRAAVGPVDLLRGADSSFFCSELVARAFEQAGVPLVGNMPAQAVSPADFTLVSTLTYVGHLKYQP